MIYSIIFYKITYIVLYIHLQALRHMTFCRGRWARAQTGNSVL